MFRRQCSYERCICRRRVLVVDNDPQFRADHVKNLTDWGYTVYTAEGKGKALLHDACEKAHHYGCHAAVVDMRLRDDSDRTDYSGLDLLPLLKPARSVLVTAYGNMQVARDALIKQGACNAVGKQEGPQALRAALQLILADVCCPALNIIWPAGWQPHHIAALLLGPDVAASAQDEATAVIAQLFPTARQVALHCLDGMANLAPAALLPNRRHSLLFLASVDDKEPIVLKFMATDQVRREQTNYEDLIRGQLGVARYAQLQASVSLWKLGASTYLFVGEIDNKQTYAGRTFTQIYRSLSASTDIMTPLRHFFTEIWAKYYRTAEPLPCALFEAYDNAWAGVLSKQFPEWRNQAEQVTFPLPTPTALPNPLRWLALHADQGMLFGLQQTVVHGDFHGDNLLIDRVYYPWIIDFERTGKGHILCDFAEITQDILTRIALLPAHDLTLVYDLALALAAPTSPGQRLVATKRIREHPEARKALAVLDDLHRLAYERTHYSDSREFLWSLLLDTLLVATLPKKHEAVQKKSLLLGSVLAQRLSLWGQQSWPPADWPAVP